VSLRRSTTLSGNVIRATISSGSVVFTGEVRGNSLTLTLGRHLQEFCDDDGLVVEPWEETSVRAGYGQEKSDWSVFDLHPKQGVLISAREYLKLPADIAGGIGTLSHAARLGLFSHYASPVVAPRFEGFLCLELFNASGHILRLKERMPVAKVVLFRTEGTDPAEGAASTPFYYNSGATEPQDLRSRFSSEFGWRLRDANH
jgi:deoxycytidine triphosphate deaminase